MTVRSILTVLVGGEGDAAALGCSVRVARHSGAHIAAVSAVSSNGAVGDLGLLPEEGGSAVMLEFEKRAKETRHTGARRIRYVCSYRSGYNIRQAKVGGQRYGKLGRNR